MAVCDGSHFESKGAGAAAWIILSVDGTSWIEGGGRIPGPVADFNSYPF